MQKIKKQIIHAIVFLIAGFVLSIMFTLINVSFGQVVAEVYAVLIFVYGSYLIVSLVKGGFNVLFKRDRDYNHTTSKDDKEAKKAPEENTKPQELKKPSSPTIHEQKIPKPENTSHGIHTRVTLNGIEPTLSVKKTKKSDRPVCLAPKVHKLRRKLYSFVVVDLETTGLNRHTDQITQISAVKFVNDKKVSSYNQYVKPTVPISRAASVKTGITEEFLKDKPRFEEVKRDFLNFVGDLPWVGHNIARFDIPMLINSGLGVEDYYVLDTWPLARKSLNLDHYNLETLKNYFGIQNRSHNALADCETNALVYQHLRNGDLERVHISQSHSKKLDGLRFVITGEFTGVSRKELIDKIKLNGGKYTSAVSHLTNYLIDGTQVSDRLTDGTHSSKELKAKEYGTKIISLEEFYSLLK